MTREEHFKEENIKFIYVIGGCMFVPCKPPSCLLCKHCTDIWWDYSNGPYMTLCDLKEEPQEHCEDFVLGDDEDIHLIHDLKENDSDFLKWLQEVTE